MLRPPQCSGPHSAPTPTVLQPPQCSGSTVRQRLIILQKDSYRNENADLILCTIFIISDPY